MKKNLAVKSTIKLVTSKIRPIMPLGIATAMLATSVTILAVCNNGVYAGQGTLLGCDVHPFCSFTEPQSQYFYSTAFYCCPDGSEYYIAPVPAEPPGGLWDPNGNCCGWLQTGHVSVYAQPTCVPGH